MKETQEALVIYITEEFALEANQRAKQRIHDFMSKQKSLDADVVDMVNENFWDLV